MTWSRPIQQGHGSLVLAKQIENEVDVMADDHDDNNGDGKLLHCNFCGKSQHEVRKLIAGPSVYVCDECVELCNDIIREELQETMTRAKRKNSRRHRKSKKSLTSMSLVSTGRRKFCL